MSTDTKAPDDPLSEAFITAHLVREIAGSHWPTACGIRPLRLQYEYLVGLTQASAVLLGLREIAAAIRESGVEVAGSTADAGADLGSVLADVAQSLSKLGAAPGIERDPT